LAVAEGFSPAGLLAPGWIGDGDLEKYNPIGIRDVMVRQFLGRLLAVFDNVFKCRMSRDGTETTMMPPMKQAAILTPSGRSMMFTMAVDKAIAVKSNTSGVDTGEAHDLPPPTPAVLDGGLGVRAVMLGRVRR
jgi:hypothetical protein